MRIVEWVLIMLIPAWVIMYTVSFSKYLKKRGFLHGAVSSLILALIGGVSAMIFFYFQAFGS